jgi:hypothetical protein
VTAPTTAAMAGCANFRIESRAVDLSAPGLLSAVTEGGVWGRSKKTSDSPLIHLLMSAVTMEGFSEWVSVICSRELLSRTVWPGGVEADSPISSVSPAQDAPRQPLLSMWRIVSPREADGSDAMNRPAPQNASDRPNCSLTRAEHEERQKIVLDLENNTRACFACSDQCINPLGEKSEANTSVCGI